MGHVAIHCRLMALQESNTVHIFVVVLSHKDFGVFGTRHGSLAFPSRGCCTEGEGGKPNGPHALLLLRAVGTQSPASVTGFV